MSLTNVKPSPSAPLCAASQDAARPRRVSFQPVDAHHGFAPIRNGDFSRRTRGRVNLPLAFLASPPSATTKVAVPEATEENSVARFQPRASRTSHRFFARGVVLLALSLIFSARPLVADEEKEGGIEILHETELASPEWIYGVRNGFDENGNTIHNGKTKKQECQRTDVGIGEKVELEVAEIKPGFGIKDDVVWEIIEGDAYFRAKKANDNLTESEMGVKKMGGGICRSVEYSCHRRYGAKSESKGKSDNETDSAGK